MSASTEIIRRLLERGLTGQAIGQAIGRDRSLVSQVGRGVKPGATLEAALSELERRVTSGERPAVTQAPPRRTTRAGTPAKVRRRTTVGKGSWRTSTIKRQAAGSGGSTLSKSLAQAADDGGKVKVTIVYAKSVVVLDGGSDKKAGKAGPGGTVTMEVDPDEYDGTMTATDWLNSQAAAEGYVGADVTAGQVESIELRVF